ncbi:hypothetical protein IGI04_015217 [Brassica rapa subsp. trilocularis]|uniref:Uncharacterized protein n=1 Tax=Brassica rapa subsp. trilocularis TaxID=1813537 RepID=A0ABQ7MPZ8_BRACM|nr:hypothetical protein IGI04_015217 [Brassica rapa subsp. trilocularis]
MSYFSSFGNILVFNQMVLIFHSFKVFQIWKTSETTYLLVTTSRKSSGLPGSLLTNFSFISSGVLAFLCKIMIYNSFTTYTEVVRPTTYMEVNQDKQGLTRISEYNHGRLKCKSSDGRLPRLQSDDLLVRRLQQDDLQVSRLDEQIWKKTDFIVSTSEITCLSHISLLQTPKISNKSDAPKKRKLQCIKSFKLVVHGGWCIDGNCNIVITRGR